MLPRLVVPSWWNSYFVTVLQHSCEGEHSGVQTSNAVGAIQLALDTSAVTKTINSKGPGRDQ